MDFFSKPIKARVADTQEPLPVGEVQETDWAVWAETVGYLNSEPMDFQSTDKLPIVPAEGDHADAFAGVTRKSK